MKKLGSLLLSLLLFLSLLPGQARAADMPPEPDDPPAQVESAEVENPGEPEEPVMPLAAVDVNEKKDNEHTDD